MSVTKKFLVHIDMGKECSVAQIQRAVPQIRETLSRACRDMEFAYKSGALDIMGFFVQSDLAAAQIHARLEAPGSARGGRDAMGSEFPQAKIMVIELGGEFCFGVGLTALGAWFRHR